MVHRPAVATLAVPTLVVAALSLAFAGCISAVVQSPPATGSTPVAVPSTPAPSGPPAIPSFIRPTPTPGPTFAAYVVVRGDNLNTIAAKFRTTARSIAFWNRVLYPTLDPLGTNYRPDRISIGWTLMVIPGVVFNEDDLPGQTPLPGETPAPS